MIFLAHFTIGIYRNSFIFITLLQKKHQQTLLNQIIINSIIEFIPHLN